MGTTVERRRLRPTLRHHEARELDARLFVRAAPAARPPKAKIYVPVGTVDLPSFAAWRDRFWRRKFWARLDYTVSEQKRHWIPKLRKKDDNSLPFVIAQIKEQD
jgi:hypothetical protein